MQGPYKSGALPILVRVLVVDDHEDTRDLYANVLRRGGFPVDTAGDAEDALRQIAARRPEIVVADYSLPQKDGFDLCRMLKSNADTRAIRVIIVTGYSGPTWEATALEVGAARFLIKPLLPDDLLSAVRELLTKGSAGVA